MICPYVTTLERACGRASTHGQHCAFHSVLHDFETQPFVDLNVHMQRLHNAIGALMTKLELRERGGGLVDVFHDGVRLGEVYLKGGAHPGWEPRTAEGSRVLGRYASKEEAAEILRKAVLG